MLGNDKTLEVLEMQISLVPLQKVLSWLLRDEVYHQKVRMVQVIKHCYREKSFDQMQFRVLVAVRYQMVLADMLQQAF